MEGEYRLRRKLEMLQSPLVREILDEMTALNLNYTNIKQHYADILNMIELSKSEIMSQKWRQLDLEEAIENEKKTNNDN